MDTPGWSLWRSSWVPLRVWRWGCSVTPTTGEERRYAFSTRGRERGRDGLRSSGVSAPASGFREFVQQQRESSIDRDRPGSSRPIERRPRTACNDAAEEQGSRLGSNLVLREPRTRQALQNQARATSLRIHVHRGRPLYGADKLFKPDREALRASHGASNFLPSVCCCLAVGRLPERPRLNRAA